MCLNPTLATRSLKVTARGEGWLEVAITDKGETKEYLVRPLPSNAGPAYHWTETQDGQSYEVELGGEHAGASCTCPWHRHKGHVKPCRHQAASVALLRAGKLWLV